MVKATWHGHATVSLEADGHTLLIDPWFDGNPAAVSDGSKLDPDFIIVTHGHADHVGDVATTARRSGARLISSPEICDWFGAQGVEDSAAMNIGGWTRFPFGRIRFTPAWHSSSLPDGTYGGMPMGVVIELAGRRIYHAGDTALFSDMKLIGNEGLDLAFLPIGSNFTMDPVQAAEAAELLRPGTVVPIHYNTFPPIRQDAAAFSELLAAKGIGCRVLAAGEALEF